MGEPSNLPGFEGLANHIAKGTTRKATQPYDRFLGSLYESGVQVHEIAKESLSWTGSKPTRLHRELVRLFRTPDNVRLVTTNFDRHFTTAAHEIFSPEQVPIHYAPGLPLGDHFNGIVYLHGSVEQEAHNLVLTDRDFGEAYLTRGWARRFLQDLFQEYTVLFVGYSHDDVVVSYLARGLPPSRIAKRYAFEKGPESDGVVCEKWQLVGVEPVFYPSAAGPDEHAELPRGTERWNTYLRMGPGDHSEHILRWVKEHLTPSDEQATLNIALDPEIEDYLVEALHHVSTARAFVSHAKHPFALRWTNEQGFLAPLFVREPLKERDEVFAHWFVDRFVAAHPTSAMQVVIKNGGNLNPVLVGPLLRELASKIKEQDLSSSQVTQWLLLILPNISGGHTAAFTLLCCCNNNYAQAALLLLDYCATPQSKLSTRSTFHKDGERNVSVRPQFVRRLSYYLDKAWNDVFSPSLETFAHSLIPIITTKLSAYHQIVQTGGTRFNTYYDTTTIRRSAIEKHPQDRNRRGLDSLIDVARDLLEWLLENRLRAAESVIHLWATAKQPLLARLALHGMSKHPSASPDEKLKWLLDREWIYEKGLKHEVFRLLEVAYPKADEKMRKVVTSEVTQRLDHIEDDQDVYEVYNLTYWLHSIAPECEHADMVYSGLQAKYSHFAPREYPDLDFWISEERPVDPESYVEALLAMEPEDVVSRWLDDSDSVDALHDQTVLRELPGRNWEWAIQFGSELAAQEVLEEKLWNPMIRGFDRADLDLSGWKALFDLLTQRQELWIFSRQISILLESWARSEEEAFAHGLERKALQIADGIWKLEDNKESPEPLLTGSTFGKNLINEAGSELTFFFLHLLSKKRANLTAIPEEYRARIERILATNSRAGRAGQLTVGLSLPLLQGLDSEWTKNRIVPVFDWSDKQMAQACWTGYVSYGRLPSALVEEFIPLFRTSFQFVKTKLADSRNDFAKRVADVCFSGVFNPLHDAWLSSFLVVAENQDRVAWAGRVTRNLEGLDSKGIEVVWDEWLEQYWDDRILGKPCPLSEEETRCMAEWLLYLQSRTEQGVERFIQNNSPSVDSVTFYLQLQKSRVYEQYPEATAKLLIHVLSHEKPELYNHRHLKKIVEGISKQSSVDEGVSELLLSVLLEQGCITK